VFGETPCRVLPSNRDAAGSQRTARSSSASLQHHRRKSAGIRAGTPRLPRAHESGCTLHEAIATLRHQIPLTPLFSGRISPKARDQSFLCKRNPLQSVSHWLGRGATAGAEKVLRERVEHHTAHPRACPAKPRALCQQDDILSHSRSQILDHARLLEGPYLGRSDFSKSISEQEMTFGEHFPGIWRGKCRAVKFLKFDRSSSVKRRVRTCPPASASNACAARTGTHK